MPESSKLRTFPQNGLPVKVTVSRVYPAATAQGQRTPPFPIVILNPREASEPSPTPPTETQRPPSSPQVVGGDPSSFLHPTKTEKTEKKKSLSLQSLFRHTRQLLSGIHPIVILRPREGSGPSPTHVGSAKSPPSRHARPMSDPAPSARSLVPR